MERCFQFVKKLYFHTNYSLKFIIIITQSLSFFMNVTNKTVNSKFCGLNSCLSGSELLLRYLYICKKIA